jgi:hypothetical protein
VELIRIVHAFPKKYIYVSLINDYSSLKKYAKPLFYYVFFILFGAKIKASTCKIMNLKLAYTKINKIK